MEKEDTLGKQFIGGQRYKVWLKQAQYDLLMSEISLQKGFFEWSSYQSQQAVEKALKSVIVHAGWRPPKLHKLPILISMCNQANNNFKDTRFEFRYLESFTFISRYPFLVPGRNEAPHDLITQDQAKKAFEQASAIIDTVEKILKQPELQKTTQVAAVVPTYTPIEISQRLDEVKTVLIKEFDPEKIILFGSFSRYREKNHSGTMDILVIAETNMPFIDRIVKARSATKGGFPVIEPLVYTPEELNVMLMDEGEGFLESALEEGMVIYDKNAQNNQNN